MSTTHGPVAISNSAIRSACNLLPHYGEDCLGPPTVALYDTLELGTSIGRHAETFDYDVTDLVDAITNAQAPLDFDRLSRAMAGVRTGSASDLAGDDRSIRIGPATDDPGTTTARNILQQLLAIRSTTKFSNNPRNSCCSDGVKSRPRTKRPRPGTSKFS